MTLALRPYQQELIDAARDKLRAFNSVVIQLPTGGGKTALSSLMLQGVAERGLKGNFIVHRQELIDQTVRTFEDFGIPHGVLSAGYAPNPYQPIQICSIDTLRHRLIAGKALPMPSLCVWDECHHIAAEGWKKVMGHFNRARHVGLTATPERLDGRGLDDLFASLVCGPSVATLIAQGFLANYRAFAPSSPDTSHVATRMGDYVRKEAGYLMDRLSITGDAVTHYLRLARGKRALAFCVSVDHSMHVAQQFCAAGVRASHLDGSTPRGERKAVIDGFRAGDVEVLCNVDLFGEGFDVPSAEAAILLRPTKSLTLYLQQVGRALRPADGKSHAIILDHAGNLMRHGLPDDERQWTLGGKKDRPRDKEIELTICGVCAAVHSTRALRCPECGRLVRVVQHSGGREVAHVDGELQELDVDALRRAKAREAAEAKSLAELTELGTRRGYRDPATWAKHYWTARQLSRSQGEIDL